MLLSRVSSTIFFSSSESLFSFTNLSKKAFLSSAVIVSVLLSISLLAFHISTSSAIVPPLFSVFAFKACVTIPFSPVNVAIVTPARINNTIKISNL